MATGAVKATIVSQYSDKGTKAAIRDFNKLNKVNQQFADKAVRNLKLATAAVGAFAIKIGKDAVSAAIEDNKSQATLANTLRNVAGATNVQIAAVEDYISTQQKLTNIQDDELRASYATLFTVTKDFTQAQALATLAQDTAVGSGKDLGSVTDILAKATQGNFTALKKAFPAIDSTIIKNKDLGAALTALSKSYKGSAKAAADVDPITKLKRSYGELLETIGRALLPALINLTNYLVDVVFPAIDNWVRANGDDLKKTFMGISDQLQILFRDFGKLVGFLGLFKGVVDIINTPYLGIARWTEFLLITIGISKVLKQLRNQKIVFGLARGNKDVIASMSFMQKAIFFIIQNGKKAAAAIGLITTAFRAQGIAAGFAAITTAFATAGVSVGLAATALATIGVTALVTKRAFDLYNNSQQKTINLSKGLSITEQTARKEFEAKTKAFVEMQKQREADAALAAITAKQEAADRKKAEEERKRKLIEARIQKKFGVKLTDPETQARIDARAIELNFIRSKKNAEADIMKQAQILKDLNKSALEEEIKLRERIQDILAAYSDDQKVDIVEIGLLAQKWKTTSDAAALYVEQILAVSDQKISDDEVANLSLMWGISKEQAGKYLDFIKVVSDGKISDAEIRNLATKWNMTVIEAEKYADFIIAVQDRELNDAEVQRLKDKWGLTNDEVTDYIVSIGAPVKYQGTILDPSQIDKLTTAWNAALAALIKYKNALGQVGFGSLGPNNNDPNAYGNSKEAIDAANAALAAANAAAEDAANEAADAAKAAADAAAELESATTLGQIRTATTTKDINDAVKLATILGESASDIANAMMVGLLGQGVDAANAASSARYTGQAIAWQQAEDAKRAKLLQNTWSIADWRRGEQASMDSLDTMRSSTINNAKGISGGNLMAAPVVNVTVQGSVTSEQDLVDAVRNGLLATQYNGNSINLQAL